MSVNIINAQQQQFEDVLTSTIKRMRKLIKITFFLEQIIKNFVARRKKTGVKSM